MVQIASPTKEQIAQDPRAFSLYCQALHGSSGFNAEVRLRLCFCFCMPAAHCDRVSCSLQLRDVTQLLHRLRQQLFESSVRYKPGSPCILSALSSRGRL
jgi:hypothetical protein